MATCPSCHQEALRIITAITQAQVIKNILRHLQLAADPPPLAPARSRQETFDWVASALPSRLAAGAAPMEGAPEGPAKMPFMFPIHHSC
jgi:hypothetical protein